MDDVTGNINVKLEGKYTHFAGMDRLTGDIEKIRTHYEKLWSSGPLGKGKAGADAGIALSLPFVALAAASTKEAVSVEDASTRTRVTYGVSQRNMATFTAFVQRHSSDLLQTQQSLWMGIGKAASAGFGPAMVQQLVTGAAKVAGVFQMSLPDAIKPASIAMKDFHLSAAQAPRAFDLMARAASLVQGGWAALFSGPTSRVMNLAATSGMSLADTLGAAVTLARRTGGGRAMGVLGALISAIDKDQGGMAALQQHGIVAVLRSILVRYGNSQKDLAKMLGGGQNVLMARALAQSGTANVGGSAGYLQGAFGRISQTLPMQFKRMQLSFEALEVSLGRTLIPLLDQLVPLLTPMIGAASSWVQHNQALAGGLLTAGIAMGALATAIRIAIPIINVLRAAWVALDVVMDANPIGLTVIALAALALGLYLAYQKVEWFRIGVNHMGRDFEMALMHPQGAAQTLLTWFQQHWVTGLAIALTGPFGLAAAYALHVFNPQLFANVVAVGDRLQGWLTGTWNGIYGRFIKPFQDALGWIHTWGENLVQHIVGGLKDKYNLIPGPVRTLINSMTSPIQSLMSWAYTAGKWIAGKLAGGMSAMAGVVRGAAASAGGNPYRTGPGTPIGPDPGTGFAPSGSFYGNFTSSPSYGPYTDAGDASEIGMAGGKPQGAVTDVDYGSYGGPQAIQLPPGFTGRLIGRHDEKYVGGVLVFQVPGGYIGMNHLTENSAFWGLSLGQSYASLPGVYSGQPTGYDPKTGAGGHGYHLCIFYDSGGRAYLANLTTQQAQQLGAKPVDGSNIGGPTGGPSPMPTLAGPVGKDHTGQPGWYFNATSGKWVHVAQPHNQKYTWDASTNQWVATATYTKEVSTSARTRTAQLLLAADTMAWGGVNPLTLSATGNHGFNQTAWLRVQYEEDKLRKTIRDNTAEMEYLRGELGHGKIAQQRLNQILSQSATTYNHDNQRAYHKLHPTPPGAASHVVTIRMDGSCPEEAKGQVHQATTSHAATAAAKSFAGVRDDLRKLGQQYDRTGKTIQHLVTAMQQRARALPVGY